MGSVKENKMKILLLFIGLYFGFDAVSGHGSMYIPSPWHATSDCDKSMDPKNCEFSLVVPETEDYKCTMTAKGQWPGGPGGCSRNAGFTFWFTNYTTVEEFNIPKEMYDKWSGRQSYAGKNPWNSPGAAPVQGNGCGVNGGNQFGCDGNYSEDGWQAVDLVSTTEGTTPEGSQWAKINLP